MMVFWLSVIFTAWGVFSPKPAGYRSLSRGLALSVGRRLFVILEMDQPAYRVDQGFADSDAGSNRPSR